ncbi:hypothetical protein GGI43DRAFT_392208 [Trichoderma evansii]
MECKRGGRAIGRSHGDIAQPYLYIFWRRSGTFHASCIIAPLLANLFSPFTMPCVVLCCCDVLYRAVVCVPCQLRLWVALYLSWMG